MSRKASIRSCLWIILVGLSVTVVGGCKGPLGDTTEPHAQVPREKLRQIETLELTRADPGVDRPGLPDANAAPPDRLELALEHCRALALENNLDLKAQLINPAVAAERLSQEEAKFEAAFFANVAYNKSDTPSVSFLDEITGSRVDSTWTDLGVRVPLRTGGTVTFDVADARTKTDANFTDFNPYFTSDFSISVSQPLLQGAGHWVNTYSIRVARYEQQITDARTKLEVIRVIAALDRVYWRLYAARKELEVRRQQHDLAKTQLAQTERLVAAGQRAPVEIVRANAGLAQQLEAIIVAETNLRDRERELKRVIHKAGVGMQSPTELIPLTEPDPFRYKFEPQRLVRTALNERMEMLELELQIAQDSETVKYMRSQALPLATLDYRYNVNGLGATRGDSFDLLFDSDFVDHRFGLQFVVPIGNEAAKSALRQAAYQRIQRLATRESREAMIELEVLNAIDQVEANWQRILAGRQNTILAARLYEAEQRQFEEGLRTSTEVFDAQTRFADAQSAEIRALTEYQISLVDLSFATGTLLGAARIQWTPVVPVLEGP